jgi:hypothetical protein
MAEKKAFALRPDPALHGAIEREALQRRGVMLPKDAKP